MNTVTWTAVVPVKAWSAAKSRLSMPPNLREELARSLTLDTLDVVTQHPWINRVIVVTADEEAAREARSRGAVVLNEAPSLDPLNDAIRQGCEFVAEDGPTVVVPADLAYVSSGVLTAALDALADAGKAHVPDLVGTGTTLLGALRASEIDPHYGLGSSELHEAAGYPRLHAVDPRARADIDQMGDLENGWTPGPRVSALLALLANGVLRSV